MDQEATGFFLYDIMSDWYNIKHLLQDAKNRPEAYTVQGLAAEALRLYDRDHPPKVWEPIPIREPETFEGIWSKIKREIKEENKRPRQHSAIDYLNGLFVTRNESKSYLFDRPYSLRLKPLDPFFDELNVKYREARKVYGKAIKLRKHRKTRFNNIPKKQIYS